MLKNYLKLLEKNTITTEASNAPKAKLLFYEVFENNILGDSF